MEIFRNEHGDLIDMSVYERDEQIFANKYITEDCVVLELGARYGAVSCIINKKINNPSNQVSVEPDERVWAALEDNMLRSDCEFSIVKGMISRRPMGLHLAGSATTAFHTEFSNIPYYTFEEIESKYGLKFDTLVADCEGFLEIFFDENPKLYDQLNLIIMEKDYPQKCNYAKLAEQFKKNGFVLLESKQYAKSPVSLDVWKKV